MADTLAFHFQPQESIIHQFDPRLKTVSLLILSPTIMVAGSFGLIVLSFAFATIGAQSGLSWRMVAYELRYFGLLIGAVFLSRALFMPGKAIIAVGPIHLTDAGLLFGGLICWRLVLTAAAGLIYAATTRPKEIRAAVQSLLAPVPGLPEKRVGVMIGLVVRLIPMILDQARETMAAQKARCIECRKNPYYRLTRFTIPVLRKTIKLADRLVAAMTARCYNEEATPPTLRIRPSDWVIFGIVAGICILLTGLHFFSPFISGQNILGI